MSWVTPLLMTISCCGYGLWMLRLVRYPERSTGERLALAFVIGVGVLGWLVFPLGLVWRLNEPALLLLVAPGVVGLALGWRGVRLPELERARWTTVVLLAGIAIAVGIDLLEALAPPADVDTIAYHFALARRFLSEGRIVFLPIAVEGAAPLLTHMTYVTALGLGGERGLTLWALTTQLALVAAAFSFARRYVSRDWALALALILLTTPAVIYTGGTGHVEPRTALFMLVATIALVDHVQEGHLGAALLAGLAAGFFMGSKYYGMFAATALGCVLLLQRRPVRPFLVFSVGVLLAGGQWYVWNWINTGDPVFPALSLQLGTAPDVWNAQIDDYFNAYYAKWTGVPVTLKWFLLYPLAATLFPAPAYEAGRTGLGVFLLLALPWVIAGLVSMRKSIPTALYRFIAVAIVFYGLWFWLPTSQLTRQLLPVFPLALLFAGGVGTQWAKRVGVVRPWAGACVVAIAAGLGIHLLYSVNYLRYHIGGESREEFLARNVAFYDVAEWINANLGSDDRVGNPLRTVNYFLEVPYVYLAPAYQARVELHPDARSVSTFRQQLERERITHLVVLPSLSEEIPSFGIAYLSQRLIDAGCARVEASIESEHITSRTMGTKVGQLVDVVAVELENEECGDAPIPDVAPQ